MTKHNHIFVIIGISGVIVSIALNLVAMLVLQKSAAVFFCDAWWSSWFPGLAMSLTFLIIGLASSSVKKQPEKSEPAG